MIRRPPRSTLFPTRRSSDLTLLPQVLAGDAQDLRGPLDVAAGLLERESDILALGETGGDIQRAAEILGDRKSTRLNSSHGYISYAVFCLIKTIKVVDVIVLS